MHNGTDAGCTGLTHGVGFEIRYADRLFSVLGCLGACTPTGSSTAIGELRNLRAVADFARSTGVSPAMRQGKWLARSVHEYPRMVLSSGVAESVPRPSTAVDPRLQELVERALPGARLLGACVLGADVAGDETRKAIGYGKPVRLDVQQDGRMRRLVLHGSRANAFGHDRRADRAAAQLLAADTFATIPRHVQALDVGAFRDDGAAVSLSGTGELYLLTEYAEGEPYAEDLRRISRARHVTPADLSRVDVLADYLVELHVERPSVQFAYARSLRDLLGSGEGIFGIVDAYDASTPGAPPARLARLEARCLEWRWQLKQRAPRLHRIHGDFHPFNVLFDGQGDLSLLDTSRGSLGDPADDVSCMAVNFVFFAIDDEAAWQAAFAPLWRRFWERYLSRSGDTELLATVAPFLTWRLLVVACPLWYPNLSSTARERLLSLAEATLARERFDPNSAEELFR